MDEHVHTTQTEQETPLTPSVGEILRNRRKEMGWSMSDVAKWSRIQQTYIEALETGKYHLLPAEVYTLGFLRTYAQLLGFDSSFLVDHYRHESRARRSQTSLNFPQVVDNQRLTPAICLVLGIVVIIVSYIGWYHFTSVTSSSSGQPVFMENSPFSKTGGYTLSPNIVTMLPDQTGKIGKTEGKLLPPQGALQSGQPKNGVAQEGGRLEKIPVQPVSSSLAERESVSTSVHKTESDNGDTEKKPLQIPVQPLLKEKSLFQEGTQKATENVSELNRSSKMSVKPSIGKSMSHPVESSPPINQSLNQGLGEDGKPFAKPFTHTPTLHIVKEQKPRLNPTSLTTDDLNERQLKKLGVQGW